MGERAKGRDGASPFVLSDRRIFAAAQGPERNNTEILLRKTTGPLEG